MVYWIVWSITKFLRLCSFPLKVVGKENIPKKGAFIFASNHRSHLDPMLIPICTTRKISFVAKESLFKGKFLGWLLPKLNAFPIKRGESDFRALRGILKRIKDGLPVVIFPEGTRVSDEKDRKVQAGIGLIAQKSKVPIVPIYLSGTQKVFPPKARKLKRYQVTVFFGEPFNVPDQLTNLEAANYIMQKILSLHEK